MADKKQYALRLEPEEFIALKAEQLRILTSEGHSISINELIRRAIRAEYPRKK